MVTQFYNPPYASVASYFDKLDVHEKEKVAGDEVLAIILSLIWAALHGANCYLLFWQGLPLIYSIAIHVILSVVIILVTKVLHQAGRDVRLLYVLAVCSTGASFFGALGVLLSGVMTILYNHFSLPFSEWYKAIYPDFSMSREQELYDRITSGKDETVAAYSVISFADIMNLGTEVQKRRAITRMTDQFHPLFAPSFKQALQDESNTVRVQAASSIIKIEDQFSKILQQIEKLEQKSDKDAKLKLGLARYYDSFAFTGLLDEKRESENRTKALKKYKEYLDLRPSDIDARIEAGRALLRSGQANQAVELFQDCIKAGYSADTLKYWLLEAYFHAGRYDELRKSAPEMLMSSKELQDIRPRLSKSVGFWAGDSWAAGSQEAGSPAISSSRSSNSRGDTAKGEYYAN